MDGSLEGRDPMAYSIDRLPDDIISHIFSFLTIRDSFRARVLSSRWQHLPDSRCDLQFDSVNTFGREIQGGSKRSVAAQSKFLKIVDCFMKIWVGNRINSLAVKFELGQEFASHIDKWVATSLGMKVEEIQLNFFGIKPGYYYVFPSHLIHGGKAPYLKRLCLKYCTLSCPFSCFECVSWVSNLTALHLCSVPLHKKGLDLILSAGSNLISLRLYYCELPTYVCIDGQLPRLKRLTIFDNLSEIKLNCPDLDVFKHQGNCQSMTFVHVPKLRKVKLTSRLKYGRLNKVTRQAPFLQVLSFRIIYEVKPLLSMVACRNLKKIKIGIPIAIDLMSITHMLRACPSLETLRLKLGPSCNDKTEMKKAKYQNYSHFRLKEVEMERFHIAWNVMEFAIYLLKNAAALNRLMIKVGMCDRYCDVLMRKEAMPLLEQLQLQEKKNPNAQVIIM